MTIVDSAVTKDVQLLLAGMSDEDRQYMFRDLVSARKTNEQARLKNQADIETYEKGLDSHHTRLAAITANMNRLSQQKKMLESTLSRKRRHEGQDLYQTRQRLCLQQSKLNKDIEMYGDKLRSSYITFVGTSGGNTTSSFQQISSASATPEVLPERSHSEEVSILGKLYAGLKRYFLIRAPESLSKGAALACGCFVAHSKVAEELQAAYTESSHVFVVFIQDRKFHGVSRITSTFGRQAIDCYIEMMKNESGRPFKAPHLSGCKAFQIDWLMDEQIWCHKAKGLGRAACAHFEQNLTISVETAAVGVTTDTTEISDVSLLSAPNQSITSVSMTPLPTSLAARPSATIAGSTLTRLPAKQPAPATPHKNLSDLPACLELPAVVGEQFLRAFEEEYNACRAAEQLQRQTTTEQHVE